MRCANMSLNSSIRSTSFDLMGENRSDFTVGRSTAPMRYAQPQGPSRK